MRITVIGCGYLGATHAACMAELGYEVLGVEIDDAKRAALTRGEVPFYEPGLPELLSKHVETGRLRFTDSYEEAASFGELHFLCVGTPQSADGLGADIAYVDAAIDTLAPLLAAPTLVVGKSTVPVGTAERLAGRLRELAPAGDGVELAWNPEFLREGFGVEDTLHPDRIVLGVTSERAEKTLRDFYSVIDPQPPVLVTGYETAELVKVAANAFLATKISFINAIAEVCEVAGADVVDLADAIGHDARIGRRFLNAGVGFGGGCLPKDIRAFLHRAGELGVEDAMSFLRQVDEINQRQRQRVVQLATALVERDLADARVAVWGAAFKPDSDDVRDSPALWIAGQLHLRGAQVVVHDPQARATASAVYPTLEYADSPLEAAAGADLVLHLTEWRDYRELDADAVGAVVRQKVLLDGRNVLDLEAWRAAGWTVRGLGRS